MTDVDTVLEERGKTHGNFLQHAAITQGIKDVMRMGRNYTFDTLDVDQLEALDMIAHKLGRIVSGDPNHTDSWLETAGYAMLIVRRLEKDAAK